MTTDLELTPADLLDRRTPVTVEDALDLHVRLDALGGWVDDRKRSVRGWMQDRAEARKAEDGAAPTWRMTDGTVLLTDPKAKPRITDPEAFARWFLYELGASGPDPDDAPDGAWVATYNDGQQHQVIGKRTVATADSADLLTFLDAHARTTKGTEWAAAADDLAERVRVDEEWLVGEKVLDDLLAGKLAAGEDGGPRVKLVETTRGWELVDTLTGTAVDGVDVGPPGDPTVQVKPTPDAKKRTRRELDDILGAPALDG